MSTDDLDYDHMILVDPELALPDDGTTFAAVDGVTIQAIGCYSATYETFNQLLEHRTMIEADLDKRAADWQREGGDYLLRMWGTLAVYGHVFTPEQVYMRERMLGARHREAARTRFRIEDARKRGWLYGRFYSVDEPEGEWGCCHVADVTTYLDEAGYLAAEARGWR